MLSSIFLLMNHKSYILEDTDIYHSLKVPNLSSDCEVAKFDSEQDPRSIAGPRANE